MRTSVVFFIALLAVIGCSSPRGPGGTGRPRDAGPQDPPPVTPQQPVRDGGALDASTAPSDSGAAPELPPNFVLECEDAAPGQPAVDPLADWLAQRDAHGALGRAATLDLQGGSYRVQGAGSADVEAPFTLRTGDISSGLVSFADARVDEIEERGKLDLFAGGLSSSIPKEAPASSGSIEGLGFATIVVEAGTLDGAIDVVSERVGNSDFHRVSAAVSELALGGIHQAFFTPAGSSGGDGRSEWIPSEPVLIHEASELTFYEEGVASVQRPLDDPFHVRYEAFGVAGDFTGGSLDVEGLQTRGIPVAIFGRAGELRFEAGSLASADGFRLTQAVNEAGLMVPAAVEIVPETREVWVRPSQSRVVRLHYRERSYLGDAVLGEIRIGGAAEDLLELQTGFLQDTLTEEIIDAVIDTGWAAPLVTLAAIPTISIVFVIDLFECIFGGCVDQPPPLEPFPQWIDAGAMGTMEVRVKGDLPVGSYETVLTFVGRNYCPVSVPLTVHVGDEPPPDAG